MRNSCDVVIEIDAAKALKDGFKILRSKNDVILIPGKGPEGLLPVAYFKNVWYKPQGNSGVQETLNLDPYQYLLILDFEANCVEEGKLECQEVIEFPVVPIDIKNLKVMEDKIFHTYVKPTVVPNITEFCTKLTGITQGQVDAGIDLVETLKRLDKWRTENGFTYHNSTIVTCGKWDLNTCLKNEAAYKQLDIPDYLRKFINIKDLWMSTFCLPKSPDMVGMLKSLELTLDGKHHSGIDDSKNIAKLAIALIKNGAVFSPQQDYIVSPSKQLASTMNEGK